MLKHIRGTGRTAAQMITAPIGAIFLINADAAETYFTALAKRLGRKDLIISKADDRTFAGSSRKIVVDHHRAYLERI